MMSNEDRNEIRAIARYLEDLIKNCTEHVPRSIELCGLGATGMIIDICDKYDSTEEEVCEECMVGSCERRRKE